MKPGQVSGKGMKRRAALRLFAAGVAGSWANAAWIEPGRLSVTRRDVSCPQLPAGLDGLRVALLADFHFRPDDDAGLLEKVVAAVRRERADLVLLAGDYISADPRVLEPLLESIGGLEAANGVFAVMGNHDGWHGSRSAFRRQFEAAGISFLSNTHSRLRVSGEELAVAGTDFVWRGQPDPGRTLRGIPREVPVLAMVHEPDYFDVMTVERPVMLQVSGHTHGGQCRVPLAGYAPVTPAFGSKYVEGLFERGDSRLFVTRGVGTTGPRVRFACPPELAVLRLRSGGRS